MTKPTPTKKNSQNGDPDPDHVDWLVEHRSATQRASAKLYRLLTAHREMIDEEFSKEAQSLVAISFSLWRSAFLSDKTGYRDDTSKSVERFLGEMLQNNSIAYSQERSSKDWTFNYYLANARQRLESLEREWKGLKLGSLVPPKGQQTPKNRWELCQKGFSAAIDYFERQWSGDKRRRK